MKRILRSIPHLGDSNPQPDTDLPSLEEAMDVLANERRRLLIHHLTRLDADDDGVEMDTLARAIAADEVDQDVAPGAVDHKSRKAVYVALHQNHIPDLENLDVIERRGSTIHGTDRLEALAELLDDIRAHWGDA